MEPRPLLFEIKTDFRPSERVVYYHLKECGRQGATREELMKLCTMSESALDKALKELVMREIAGKTDSRPVRYLLKC